jgi:hypothetical protein
MLQHERFAAAVLPVRRSARPLRGLPHCPRALPAPFGAEFRLAAGGPLPRAGVAGGGLFHLVHRPVVGAEKGGRGPGALSRSP